MKVAVFSDVHGNLSALEAVLDSIRQHSNITQVIFAGDLCVFGPRPSECISLLKEQPYSCVVGNTDEWIINPPIVGEDLSAEEVQRRLNLREICQWTRDQLDESELKWLFDLQPSFSIRVSPTINTDDDLLVVHANPLDLSQIIFPPTAKQQDLYGSVRQPDAELEPIIGSMEGKILAFGHLHIPFQRKYKDKLLVNISSVSIPGDGDSRAKYAILSWEQQTGWTAEHFYIPFSIQTEIEAFRINRPPFWEDRIETLNKFGYIPQVV